METPVNYNTRTTDDLIMCATDSEVEMLRNQFMAASFIYRLGFHSKQYLNAHKPGHDHNTHEYFNYAKKFFNYVNIGDILKILKCVDSDYEKWVTYTGPSDFDGACSLALYSNCQDPFGQFIKDSYSYHLYTMNRAHDVLVDVPIQVYIRFPYSIFRVFRKELEYSSDERIRLLSANGVFNDPYINEDLIDVLPSNIDQFDLMYDVTRTSTGIFNGFGHTVSISSLYMSIILNSDNIDYYINNNSADHLSVVSISPLLISRRCSNTIDVSQNKNR